MSSPQFKVFKYTLAVGEVQTIHRPANTAICLKASQVFEIAFDDQPLTEFQQGLSYEAIGTFKKVQIKNNSASVLTVELGLASGGIRDARLSIEGGIDANITGGNIAVTGAVDANITNGTVNVGGAVDANITNATVNVGGAVDANITGGNVAVTGAVNANITNDLSIKSGGTLANSTVSALATARTTVAAISATRKEIMVTNLGADMVFLGNATVGLNQGQPCDAGQTVTLETTAELKVWNPTASAISLAVLELST